MQKTMDETTYPYFFQCNGTKCASPIPDSILDKLGIDKLRIYYTAENLLTFTKYSGYDPEIGGGIFGIDRGYYPQAVTNQLGINLQF